MPRAAADMGLPEPFAGWFAARGWRPRPHQLELIQAVKEMRSVLLIAPTGGGKTLAGFLPSLIELNAEITAWAEESGAKNSARPHRLHTLYVSPLKALTQDVARNLQAPAEEMGLEIRIETRTGDTPSSKRQRQRAKPPDILLTTPEQLALFIAQENGEGFFGDLKAVIIDEAHALAPSKRGDMFTLGLAAIERWAPNHRRVGLSATVPDADDLARWLAAQTPGAEEPTRARIVRGAGGAEPRIDVLASRAHIPWSGHTGRHTYEEVYEAIKTAKTALVFVNTRSQAEMTFQGLWAVNEDALPIALHHGSLAVEQRRKVEAAMTRGELRGVVCTSTLDLGIDWGDVDLVIQMGAPKGSSRLIQRIGRANHRLDEPSRALLAPSNRFEVLECRAAQEAVAANDLDGDPLQPGALDVLAQHVTGRACGDPFTTDGLFDEVRTAAPYAELSREMFEEVLDFACTGGYALRTYDRFARIVQTPDGLWRVRTPQIAQQHRLNVGAIVEEPMMELRLVGRRKDGRAPPEVRAARGASPLRPASPATSPAGGGGRGTARLASDGGQTSSAALLRGGRAIGQTEEWFISQLAPGDSFIFAGQNLRLEGVMETTAFVSRSYAPEATVPSFMGGKFPLSTFLAKRVRATISNPGSWDALPDQVAEWLRMQQVRSVIPSSDEMLVETFPRSHKHYLVCYPFEGRLAHQTLGMLLTRRLERAGLNPLGFVANDYALSIWALGDIGADADIDALFDEDMLGDDLDAWLAESIVMKRTFRNCALISGLIARRTVRQEKTGRQVAFSTDLIYDVLRQHDPQHLLLKAAWRDAATGLLDIRRLGDCLARIRGAIRHVKLERISPLAVPVMLEIGRVPIDGGAAEALMAETAEELISEAME